MNDPRNVRRLGKWARFKRWLLDPKNTVFHRSILNLSFLVLFYLCFTFVIVSLMCLMIFVVTTGVLRPDTAWLSPEESCLGTSPGLGYRPALHLESPLIWYKWSQDEMYYTSYVQEIELFMQTYEMADPDHYRDCGGGGGGGGVLVRAEGRHRDRPCYFNVSQLGPCGETSYGYMQRQPCLYLKLNRINGWRPDCYNDSTDLPEDMPDHLKEHIASGVGAKENMLWVSCEGYYPADEEHLGSISYYPQPGFSAAYFPYQGQRTYLSPIVAVQFNKPMSMSG